MKSRQYNDMIDHTSLIFVEYDIKLSRPIRQCAVYDENKIGQRCDQWHKSTQC